MTIQKQIILLVIIFTLIIPITLIGQESTKDTASYKKLTIKKTELDFVGSYYTQDGDHSAVTGGTGTEQLDFIGANIDVNVYMDKGGNEHVAGLNLGLDYYSSASSDNIDPTTVSGASSADLRINPTFSWKVTNPKKYFSLGANISLSTEYDYKSFGLGFSASKFSKDLNRELSFKWQSYFDQWKIILPIELRPEDMRDPENSSSGTSPRNSHAASLTFSQVINKKLQVQLTGDFVFQDGLLSTPYHRVFVQGEDLARLEKLPSTRTKIPMSIRLNYFLSDAFIIRTTYRYYTDSWDITAHTFNVEIPVKINPFFSVYPYYRYHTQTAATYFAPYGEHNPTEEFITSDYDLSALDTHLAGAGIRWSPLKGIARMPKIKSKIKMMELRYGNYSRSDGLNANIFSFHLSFTGF